MTRCVFSLLLVLLPTPYVCAQQHATCCYLSKDITTLLELGREYKRLRREIGSVCCNRFGSGLMAAMTALRDSLQPGSSAKRVTSIMGRPDLCTRERYGAVAPSVGDRLLIYYWRGSHDFLYFVVSRGQVIKSEWYNAWE